MDRLTRKELKTDNFALEVEHGVEYVAGHKMQLTRYATIAAVVIALVAGIWAYRSYSAGVREDALRSALRVQEGPVGSTAPPSELAPTFKTQEEKDQASKKALTEVAEKYAGSDQGSIARYFLGTIAADKGDMATAEKSFKEVSDNGPKDYASLAKLALASIYKSQGKLADGEKLLRGLMDNPTIFVSKEEATITLGQYLAATNPAEARKLIEPLRGDPRSAVSRAALSALSEIPQK